MRLQAAVLLVLFLGLPNLGLGQEAKEKSPNKEKSDPAATQQAPGEALSVGAATTFPIKLPGGEIEPIPRENRKAPNNLRIDLRIEKSIPIKDGFEYHIAFRGFQPHKYDLRDYFRRKDPQSTDPLPDRPEWHIEVVPGIGPTPTPIEKPTQKVGVIRVYDVILPGGEIEPIPQEDRKSPIVLRMEKVDPTETGFHYRISCMGLEPGIYDLRKYLRRKDIVSTIPDRPDWHIEVVSTLPPGQILPRDLGPQSSIRLGGYKYILAGAVLFWGLGFLAIILWPGPKPLFPKAQKVEITAADRLRPLVEKALKGDLSLENQAALEATLMAFWRRRLALENAKPVEALASLRVHPEAGALLRTLEDWLHRPADKRPNVNIEALLEPYRKVQAESLDLTGSSRS